MKPLAGPHLTRRGLFTSCAIAGASVPALCNVASAQSQEPPPFITERSQFVIQRPLVDVSSVRLRRADGTVQTLGTYRGKSVLLAFRASWRPPCRRELPVLADLQARAKTEPFQIVPIALDWDPTTALRFVQSLGLHSFTTFVDPDGALASGPDGRTPFRLYGMPMSYVVDGYGLVAGYIAGEADWSAPVGLDLLRLYGKR